MVTLPEGARARRDVWVVWKSCEGCGQQFAPEPGQRYCSACGGVEVDRAGHRCPLTHPDDRSRCDGAPDAVVVVDQVGDEAAGCVRHAAAALASILDARVLPAGMPGGAVAAYERAQTLRPFTFGPNGAGGER